MAVSPCGSREIHSQRRRVLIHVLTLFMFHMNIMRSISHRYGYSPIMDATFLYPASHLKACSQTCKQSKIGQGSASPAHHMRRRVRVRVRVKVSPNPPMQQRERLYLRVHAHQPLHKVRVECRPAKIRLVIFKMKSIYEHRSVASDPPPGYSQLR